MSSESSLDLVRQALVRFGPATTAAISERLDLPVSTVSRHLLALRRTGLADADRVGTEVFYQPARNLSVAYTGPSGHGPSAPWITSTWRSAEPLDWRFPRVSAVPDGDAVRTLHRLLARCQEEGLFHPWLALDLPAWLAQHDEPLHDRMQRKWRDAANWGRFELVVYGSCARGDARDDSDLDVLLLGPNHDAFLAGEAPALPWPAWPEDFQRIVDEINLGAPRYVHAALAAPHLHADHLIDMAQESRQPRFPARLQAEIVKEGLTVFTSDGVTLTVEARRAGHGG